MKIFLLGNAQSHPEAIGLINEDLLLNPAQADAKLDLHGLKIDHIETVNGEKIVYIHEGHKWWEGTKEDILHADNRELNDFVFASAMAKRAKGM